MRIIRLAKSRAMHDVFNIPKYCVVCGKHLGGPDVGKNPKNVEISHGYCEKCLSREMARVD